MKFEPNEIVVELDHPKNSNVYFHPLKQELRSKILPYRTPGRPLATMEWINKYSNEKGIPGQRIHLDVDARRGRVVDGLGDDKDWLDQFKKDCLSGNYRILANDPQKEIVRENLSDIDISTWLYWMRRLVEKEYKDAENRKSLGRIARVVHGSGRLPSLDDIVARGNVLRPIMDNRGIRTDKGETEFYQPKQTQRQTAKAGKQ